MSLSKKTKDEIYSDTGSFSKEIAKAQQFSGGANLLVKGFPTTSVGVRGIKSHFERIEANNFIPDVVFVDYAEIVGHSAKYSDYRFVIKEIYEELRGFASEKRIALWTAA